MPLKEGITINDVIDSICRETCRLPGEPDTEHAKDIRTAVSNAGYMILSSMGFVHEEISKMLDAAQKVRYAAVFKRLERQRKRH